MESTVNQIEGASSFNGTMQSDVQNIHTPSSLQENMQWLDTFLGTLTDEVEEDGIFQAISPSFNLDLEPLLDDPSIIDRDGIDLTRDDIIVEGTKNLGERENVLKSRKELEELLEIREKITKLLGLNESYMETLRKNVSQIRLSIEEVNKFQNYLSRSDDIYQYTQRGATIPLNNQEIKLPMFPEIYQEIPRIAYEAKEIEDLRIHSSKFVWSDKEAAKLNDVVLNHCKKGVTMHMAKEGRTYDEVLGALAALSDEELAQHSIPQGNPVRLDEEPIDWNTVALEIGGTHTPEDCRTRWLMIQRPGINQNPWSSDESTTLRCAIQNHQVDGLVKDWIAIAREVGNGRTAIDCFCACQKNGLLDAYTHTLPSSWAKYGIVQAEAEEIERLFGIWHNRSVVLHERLGTSRPKSIIGTRIGRLQSALQKSPESWQLESDIELVRYLAKSVKSTRPHILREPLLVQDVNWESDFPMKPHKVTSSEVQERWQKIVKESRVHPQRYIGSTKRTIESDSVPTCPKRPRGRPRKQ